MKNQVTILGLGMIGSSIGLALSKHNDELEIIGHDKDVTFASKAKKNGAVAQTVLNLHKAVEKADIIFLCLPANELNGVMRNIADDLKEDVVIFDTSPVRLQADAWARELLPATAHYVGLTPILNPDYLHKFEGGINGAKEDLFEDGYFAINCNAFVEKDAIDLAIAMVDYLGADSIFADIPEVDGLMTAGHTLPQLVAAALVNTNAAQTGWFDIRKYAGRAFAETTLAINNVDLPDTIAAEALMNKANTVRLLQELENEISSLREWIEKDDAQRLVRYLDVAKEERETWWDAKETKSWEKERPDLDLSSGEMLKSMFGMLPDKVKKMGNRDEE